MARESYFNEFLMSFIDGVFDITSDERWEEEIEHFSSRHFVSEKEAEMLAARNPSQLHSFFAEGWDIEKVRDEGVAETMNDKKFIKYIYQSRKDRYFATLIPAKNCGIAVRCLRDEDNKIVGFKKSICNAICVVFDIEKSVSEGYDVVCKMALKTAYPANQELVRRIRFGKF